MKSKISWLSSVPFHFHPTKLHVALCLLHGGHLASAQPWRGRRQLGTGMIGKVSEGFEGRDG